jgi:hypothetical protein
VYEDTDGNGKPDRFYYNRSTYQDDGYYVNNSFTKASGHSRTITFYDTPSNTIYMEYVVALDDFTGTGTEYSFFPSNLLLAKAQMLYLEDDGRVSTSEYQLIYNRMLEEIRDLCHSMQIENADMICPIKDDKGAVIEVESYGLSNADETINTTYENSVDLR